MSPSYRVYVGPEPDGPHPGYRGELVLSEYGVWCDTDAEWLLVLDVDHHSWEPVTVLTLVPWHSISLIEDLYDSSTNLGWNGGESVFSARAAQLGMVD